MDPELVRWLLLDDGGGNDESGEGAPGGELGLGSLDEARELATGNRVTVLVPSLHIVLTSAQVPTQNRQRLAKALPYILEDQLADDIDDLHFALGGKRGDNTIGCAVVRKQLLEQWLERLDAHHIRPQALLPDILSLPLAEGEWTLLREDGHYLLRTGAEAGYSLEGDLLQDSLQMLLDSTGETARPWRISFYDADLGGAAPPDFSGLNIEVDPKIIEAETLALLGRQVPDKPGLNLLQGDYSRRERIGKFWRPWLPAAAMLGAVIVLQLLTASIDYFRLRGQATAINDEVVKAYMAAYPGTKEAPASMMEQYMTRKLKALKGGGSGGSGFLAILTNSGAVFAETPGVVLRNVRYHDGKLELNLDLNDLQTLDTVKQKLADQGGLVVDILSANAKGDKVESRLQLAERG